MNQKQFLFEKNDRKYQAVKDFRFEISRKDRHCRNEIHRYREGNVLMKLIASEHFIYGADRKKYSKRNKQRRSGKINTRQNNQ